MIGESLFVHNTAMSIEYDRWILCLWRRHVSISTLFYDQTTNINLNIERVWPGKFENYRFSCVWRGFKDLRFYKTKFSFISAFDTEMSPSRFVSMQSVMPFLYQFTCMLMMQTSSTDINKNSPITLNEHRQTVFCLTGLSLYKSDCSNQGKKYVNVHYWIKLKTKCQVTNR